MDNGLPIEPTFDESEPDVDDVVVDEDGIKYHIRKWYFPDGSYRENAQRVFN